MTCRPCLLQFQLTVNFVALVIAFVAAITNGETPLNVIQLLWVNLIMDALGALGEWSTPAAWQWQGVVTAPSARTLLTHVSCAWYSAATRLPVCTGCAAHTQNPAWQTKHTSCPS